MKTVILVPSRSRAARLEKMIKSTTSLASNEIEILVAVDGNDPMCSQYASLNRKYNNLQIFSGPRDSLSGWTNFLANVAIRSYGVDDLYLVSMGDDHKVKSSSWDIKLINAIKRLDGPGFAYGDDLMNGPNLCTAWMASAEVVEALGWMMLPTCKHMYVDNCIMELGKASNRIAYVESVTIEHLHPVVEKAKIDDTYVHASSSIGEDLKAFNKWKASEQFTLNVKTIQELTWS